MWEIHVSSRLHLAVFAPTSLFSESNSKERKAGGLRYKSDVLSTKSVSP